MIKGLEERLLHFTHARKPPPDTVIPTELHVKHVAQTLLRLKQHEPRVAEYYRELCEVTHPNAMSIMCFARPGHSASVVYLDPAAEVLHLEALRKQGLPLMPLLMALGVTIPVLVLKVLNAVPVPDLGTPFAETIRLDGLPAWENLVRLLKLAAP